MSRTPKYFDIPNIVYDNLRAVHESRVRRQLDADKRMEFEVPHITNAEIFVMFPDRHAIDWSEAAQPAIMNATLAQMFASVEFPH